MPLTGLIVKSCLVYSNQPTILYEPRLIFFICYLHIIHAEKGSLEVQILYSRQGVLMTLSNIYDGLFFLEIVHLQFRVSLFHEKALTIFFINGHYQHYHYHFIIADLSKPGSSGCFCSQNMEVLT